MSTGPEGPPYLGGWASGACGPDPDPQTNEIDDPANLVDMSLPLTQWRADDDRGHLVIVANDAEHEVIFGPGHLGNLNSQIAGAERAAEWWARYVTMLRIRRGDRQVLAALVDVAPARVEPPMHASGL